MREGEWDSDRGAKEKESKSERDKDRSKQQNNKRNISTRLYYYLSIEF